MAKQTITIYKIPSQGGYIARHSDPNVRELFGTDTLPTAWTAAANPATVEREMVRLNPGVSISMHESCWSN